MTDRAHSDGSVEGAIDTKAFRGALGCFATGVTIITTCTPRGERAALTVNSFSSVSLEPPMVLWSLSLFARSLPLFQESKFFAVNVLARDQQHLSDRFAKSAADKFDGVRFEEGIGRSPLIPDVVAQFECRTANRYHGGDHIIFLGQVERFGNWDREPLVFHRGSYADLK